MTKVLVVHQWMPPGAPHDQQRGRRYAPLFKAAGVSVEYVGRRPIPVLDSPRLLRSRGAQLARRTLPYRAFTRVTDVAMTAANDIRIVRRARDADVVLLIKVDSLDLVRGLREATSARLVYDLADARRPDPEGRPGLTPEILAGVDAVTADNSLGVAYALRYNRSVHLWPTTSYVEEFDAKRSASRRGRDGRVVLGWLGSETTVWNLYTIIEALEDVFRRHPHLHLRLLGVPSDHQLLSLFEHVRASNTPAYDADEMIDEVLSMDIGLFPVMALENAAMHGITKALVYMGGAAAIVASPVGDIPALIRDGENGLLASGREDWAAKLDRLIVDPALRDRIAQQGLRTAREGYSLSRCFDHLREALGI